ncbi:MAG: ParB/RepB/Spo0J family partition protein [Candidatus Niyogibacteria bacterium]|nr:ParB/RepB/Spo0J family partition protein [Candidatus Niyogibacteria bacterium]
MENNQAPTGQNLRIFWVETEKIKPNPLQPRRDFDETRLNELAESIRQYGVIQPLVVVRKEYEVDRGTVVDYELVAGERRLRASKLAGLTQVPVIIRQEPAERVKLELALIENIQREDLNPVERAVAFKRLIGDFAMRQREIGAKIGKSREFVANSIRILNLPKEMQAALSEGKINEGHTRPLLMLSDRLDDQQLLFKDILYKNLSVRDAEKISRHIARDRARKQDGLPDPQTRQVEEKLTQALGTRVSIERKGQGGVIAISFFSDEELVDILEKIAQQNARQNSPENSLLENFSAEELPAPDQALPGESAPNLLQVQTVSDFGKVLKDLDKNNKSGSTEPDKDILNNFTV